MDQPVPLFSRGVSFWDMLHKEQITRIYRSFSSGCLQYFQVFSFMELYITPSFAYIISKWLWLSYILSSASSFQRDYGFSTGVLVTPLSAYCGLTIG